jgi:hypothetical protein
MLMVTVIMAATAINLLVRFLPLGNTAIQAIRLAVIAAGLGIITYRYSIAR